MKVLSPKTQYNLANARTYFEEHLGSGDYYSEGQKVRGEWTGAGAQRLCLNGEVSKEEFHALCENRHPHSRARLTQQSPRTPALKPGTRQRHAPKRRIFYDFTISPPKSVSIACLAGNDPEIAVAHGQAIKEAVSEMEQFAATRVRRAGANSNRLTQNFVCATFTHETSRALDPHLHTHCIVFNATFDTKENRWKSLQNSEILRAQKFIENVYYHELSRRLGALGYRIKNKPRGDFELEGFPEMLLDRFSKRHIEIQRQTDQFLASRPVPFEGNLAQVREHMAQNRRSRKVTSTDHAAIRGLWRSQLTSAEIELIRQSRQALPAHHGPGAEAGLQWSEQHLFERCSVVPEHALWRHALEYARGGNFSIAALKELSARRDYLRTPEKHGFVTTREVLRRELEILDIARNGAGKHTPLNAQFCAAQTLDDEQRRAVAVILSSRDLITLFRGGAGTGKSFALREVCRGLNEAGLNVEVIAPQRQQVVDLQSAGFQSVRTVSELLCNRTASRGSVIILDEAGQLGARQMLELLKYAQDNASRLICAGDTRQHGAVEASDAIRTIEKFAGLHPAEISRIRRQDPARAGSPEDAEAISEYRRAVQEAAHGLAGDSFDRLQRLGWVHHCHPSEQQSLLAQEYLKVTERGASAVVVSQTWSEIHQLNASIRDTLKRAGLVSADETMLEVLEPSNLTNAQKRDPRSYGPDDVIVFATRLRGFRKNQQARMVSADERYLALEGHGRIRMLSVNELDAITVWRKRRIPVAKGDLLQLKANAKTESGARLCNGEIVKVRTVLGDGSVETEDGRRLGPGYRNFVPGFAVTSYASQGKTVDHVLFSDAASQAATSLQQWYVSVSRGRKSVRIFTADPDGLRKRVHHCGHRQLAVDLLGEGVIPQTRKMHRIRRRLQQTGVQIRNACRRALAKMLGARKIQNQIEL